MVVWSGYQEGFSNAGRRYNPARDSWASVGPTDAPSGRRSHSAVWTGSEMIIWGGQALGGATPIYLDDTFIYIPGRATFPITSVVLNGGDLTISFPTATNCTYTLWRSDTLAGGTWTDSGLPALVGTGATLAFTVPAPTTATRFFRVQLGP